MSAEHHIGIHLNSTHWHRGT